MAEEKKAPGPRKIVLDVDSANLGLGNSVLGIVIAVSLMFVLFKGEPNIAESLRVAAAHWAASLGK